MSSINYIDGSEIRSVISSGGHAIVYKGWDERLEKYYAIKVMLNEVEDEDDATENAARFETEAKVLAQLEHPNISRIYNAGEYEGRPFIKMDFVDGYELGKLIRKNGKIPLNVTCAIVLQVARALSYAHNHEYKIYDENRYGVIHRDIKPGNILINKEGQVKLIDFGIVKVDRLSIHTQECDIIGTYNYMSPEQQDPPEDGQPLDQRADIFGLGCVLYECLTGKYQFQAKTCSLILEQKLENNYDLKALKKLPKNIKKIISLATANNKDERFLNAEEVIKELEKVLIKSGEINPEETVKRFLNSGNYNYQKNEKSGNNLWVVILFLFLVIAAAVIFRPEIKKILNRNTKRIQNDTIPAVVSVDTNKVTSGKEENVIKKSPVRETLVKKEKKYIQTGSKIEKRKDENRSEGNTKALPTPEELKKNNAIEIYSLFIKGMYREVIEFLSDKNVDDLSDSLYLALCGSYMKVSPGKLEQVVFSRTPKDGYIRFLRGIHYYNKGSWLLAKEEIHRSMGIRTIYLHDEDALFYLVQSAYRFYKEKPNISNRNFFKTQKNLYLTRYCRNVESNDHCKAVERIGD